MVEYTSRDRRHEDADASTYLREQLDRDSNVARQPPVGPIALEAFGDGSSSSYEVPQMEISSRTPILGGIPNFVDPSGEQLVISPSFRSNLIHCGSNHILWQTP